MIRKLLWLTFGIIFFLIISNKFTPAVQGQSPSPTPAGPAPQSWRCLKTEQVGGQTVIPPPEVDIRLTGAGFPSLHDIYVVLCLPGDASLNQQPINFRCSTGNSEFDRLIFASDLTSNIAPASFEIPKGSIPSQPVQAPGGNFDHIVYMKNADGHVNYAYFGVTINEPSLVSEERGDTLQYGTFQFEQSPEQCVSLRWDPYGRVFDSQSLEPMRNIRVSILDFNKKLLKTTGLVNPQKTEEDGQFNFYVAIHKKGRKTYYLTADPPATHKFIDNPNLHPNYDKVYSDIYHPGDPIVEREGVPEHRDIPLDPGVNTPYRANPVSMSLASMNLGNSTRYEGIVSHPLSIITLVGKVTQTEVARTSANKFGIWEIIIPNTNIPQNESLVVKILKVDLTTLAQKSPDNLFSSSVPNLLLSLIRGPLTFINSQVSAQGTDTSTSVDDAEFPPILTYIEGYAYDHEGNVIPNAAVNVRLYMSGGLYYQTTADQNGFFSIKPENLPIFVYYLEFVSPERATPVKMDTIEFAEKNKEHLTTNNVNLMSATKDGQSLIPTSQVNPPPEGFLSPTAAVKPDFISNNLNFILIIIALVVLLGIAGGVLLYIKKKQSQQMNEPL